MERFPVNVLVTGTTGFLGGHLARRLIDLGFEVTGTGRSSAPNLALSAYVRGDLADPKFHLELPRRIDAVVHCAALSSPWGRPSEFERANVLATRHVLDYARRARCRRFVHVSSPSLYVDRCDRLDVREDDPMPTHDLNDYIRTKRVAESLVDGARAAGLSTITLRPQGIVGPGDRSILPRLVRAARRGLLPRIAGGRVRTDLTHVANVVEAIELALDAPAEFSGRKYNVTDGEPIEIYDFIARVMERLEIQFRWKDLSLDRAIRIGAVLEWASRWIFAYREPRLTRYTACTLGTSRTLNLDRIRGELGYEPRRRATEVLDDLRPGVAF